MSRPRIERLVPAPSMSPAGATAFSLVLSSNQPAQALHAQFRGSRVAFADLQQIAAHIWTRTDSPTSDLGEDEWIEIFQALGFFSWPPLITIAPDGTQAPLRPKSITTLYRGSTAERSRGMSWTSDRQVAEELGRRHLRYGVGMLYQAEAPPNAVLADLERRDDRGWTIVVDPDRLIDIGQLGTITF